MPITDNILIKPVNPEEVFGYMGIAPSSGIYDTGPLCGEYNHINKWAKCKPIRYPKKEELTDEERVGHSTDRMNGIFYGVKISTGSGQIATLHNVTFDYYPIRAGIDWARLSDFDGYDKNAKPNPMGELPEVINPDIDPAVGECSIVYDSSNTTGIDLSGAISSMHGVGDDAILDGTATEPGASLTIGDFYPCVLVTYEGKNYVRALWNKKYSLEENYINCTGSNKTKGFTTYVDNGVWNWQWALIADGLPNLADGKEMLVTAFFTRAIEGSNPSTFNWRNWTEITEGSMQINPGYAIPEAVAKQILIQNYYTKGIQIYGGTWGKASGTSITISLDWAWIEPTEGATYTIRYTIYPQSNLYNPLAEVVKSYVYQPDLMVLLDFTADVGLLNIPTSTNFILQWQVTSSQSSKPCNSGQATLQNINN